MIQFKENTWTDGRTERQTEGWKDRQTLFYRTLPATASGPKKNIHPMFHLRDTVKVSNFQVKQKQIIFTVQYS